MGVWQRTLLQSGSALDTTSLVLWMQTQHYHIDIRIPTAVFNMRKVNQLSDYTTDELHLLAQQQGFAGLTQVPDDICQWHREIDYQPKNDQRDIGKMAFKTPNLLIETGVDADYLEHWQRLNETNEYFSSNKITGKNRHGVEVPAYLMRSGNHVAYARQRSVSLPKANSIIQAVNLYEPSIEMLCDWLDMEISFGMLVNEYSWIIEYSTLPYKQGLTYETHNAQL